MKILYFGLTKETKGALRYDELTESSGLVNPDPKDYTVGGLYIRKHAVPQPYPQQITVTIENAG